MSMGVSKAGTAVVGLGDEDRNVLRAMDFSRDLQLEFWLFLEKRPQIFRHLFSVKEDEFRNSLAVGMHDRRLKIYHGTGERRVILLNEYLRERTLPLRQWVKVSISRRITDQQLQLDVHLGRWRRRVRRRRIPGQLPYRFEEGETPPLRLLGDGPDIGFMAEFRFEGAEGQFLRYEDGHVVTNVTNRISTADVGPLTYRQRSIERGTQNQGIYIHALHEDAQHQFRIVEKKTSKPLEIVVVRFLAQYQRQDPGLAELFPEIYWTDDETDPFTYLMEYLPGTGPGAQRDIFACLQDVVRGLCRLAEIGERSPIVQALPDVFREFDVVLDRALAAPNLVDLHPQLRAYAGLRRKLIGHRLVLSHNDVKMSNLSTVNGCRFLDLGSVAMNFVGADLINIYRYHGRSEEWARAVTAYARAFGEPEQLVQEGAVAFAVQREVERFIAKLEQGRGYDTAKLARYLAALNLGGVGR